MAHGRPIRRCAVVLTLCALAVAACSGPARRTAAGGTRVTVSPGDCGHGWSDPRGGDVTFMFVNDGGVPVQADLVDPRSGAVFAEVEGLGPGTSRPVHARVGRGRYAFRCIPADGGTARGPTVTITNGPRRRGPATVPVAPAQLIAALRSYDHYVTVGLQNLRTATVRLRRAAGSGDRSRIEKAWVPAHLAYERLGAAYGAFGDFAERIDGIPRNGEHPGVAGFHRIEYLLWHGQSLSRVRSAVRTLAHDVSALQADFPKERIDPNDLALRAHEILEASLQFELTGDSDQGSGTNLATVDANIDGTEAVLAALAPALRTTGFTQSAAVHASLDRLRRLVRAQHRDGRWRPVQALSRGDRERIDAAAGEALELLARVATVAAVRRTE